MFLGNPSRDPLYNYHESVSQFDDIENNNQIFLEVNNDKCTANEPSSPLNSTGQENVQGITESDDMTNLERYVLLHPNSSPCSTFKKPKKANQKRSV